MRSVKPVILCVDDDAAALDSLQLILERGGYRVVPAATVAEAIAKFRSDAPDAVLIDLMMEEIDSGASLAIQLKAAGSKAPMFLVSSIGEQLGRTTDPARLGFSGVFQKPIDADALLAAMKAHLAG